MTAKQPIHDSKFDGQNSRINAESKRIQLVIRLTRQFSATPYFDATDPDVSEPTNLRRTTQEDVDLPSFPGESWFGG